VRVADEVSAVEQQMSAAGIGCVGDRLEAGDDRVVAAADGLHQPICYSLNSLMKERIMKRFSDEIAALERELKVDLPKEIQRARELGDLRENAEYKAAKDRQDIVNARIAMLKKRVGEISLMNLDRIPKGRAGFGSTVELKAASGEMLTYQLVMPEEADAERGLISTSSPIGRAILNKEEGDEITVTTPSGTRTFDLVKLTTIHD
jgi:transcription elongation factor GreA